MLSSLLGVRSINCSCSSRRCTVAVLNAGVRAEGRTGIGSPSINVRGPFRSPGEHHRFSPLVILLRARPQRPGKPIGNGAAQIASSIPYPSTTQAPSPLSQVGRGSTFPLHIHSVQVRLFQPTRRDTHDIPLQLGADRDFGRRAAAARLAASDIVSSLLHVHRPPGSQASRTRALAIVSVIARYAFFVIHAFRFLSSLHAGLGDRFKGTRAPGARLRLHSKYRRTFHSTPSSPPLSVGRARGRQPHNALEAPT